MTGKRAAARVIAQMVTHRTDSRKALQAALGMSKASVSRTVEQLLDLDLLRERAAVPAPVRGRPSASLEVRSDLVYLLGGDLEGGAVRACLLDSRGAIASSGKVHVGPRWSVPRMLDAWAGLIADVAAQSGVDRERIAGLGIGLPGVVTRDGNRSHSYLPPGQWVDIDPMPALARLGFPTLASKNVVCTSEYERRLGVARGRECFLSVLARYGLAAAMCGQGEFLSGEELAACEFGHMRINTNGPKCVCGRKGCLHVYAAGYTLPPAGKRKGAAWAGELRRRGQALAVGMANLLKVFPAPLVAINGVYNAYEAELRPLLEAGIAADLSGVGLTPPELVFADRTDFKSSIGAALRAADAFLPHYLTEKVLIS